MKCIVFLALLVSNIWAYGNQLVVGVIKFAPPFVSEINNAGEFYGFCIELMNEVCKRIGDTCQYKATDLGKQLDALRQGTIDVAFLTSPVVPTPNQDYLYSLPYIPSQSQFMVLSSNTTIHSLEEIKGKKIGVLKSSNLKNTFLRQYTSAEQIFEYQGITDLISAINAKRVDTILINSSVSKYIINNIQNLKIIGQPINIGMGYGVVALKKNARLINQINAALLQMEADGTYEMIYKKYFGY